MGDNARNPLCTRSALMRSLASFPPPQKVVANRISMSLVRASRRRLWDSVVRVVGEPSLRTRIGRDLLRNARNR